LDLYPIVPGFYRKEDTMKRSASLSGVFAAVLLTMFLAPAHAGAETIKTQLLGFQETPLTINSGGSGEFKAKISKDGTSIDYALSYSGLSSNVRQAHIHFGRPAISGGIVLFLCTNLPPPAGVPTPQACPVASGTITGTLTAADVIPVPGQGIDAGAPGFAEMVAAMRRGAAYANVHTNTFPTGEIRGPLSASGHDNP
jgi:hypothetical protein